jgi:integrase
MSSTHYVNPERAIQDLKPDIHPENVAAIQEFMDSLAAEGLSATHQDRQVRAFKMLLTNFAPDGFRLQDATEDELKTLLARMNRSDYAESSKVKMKAGLKKFYKLENGGDYPDKVTFFTVSSKKDSTVTREDLFTEDELQRLFCSFNSTRDKAFTMVLYESAARPGELLSRNIADFTTNEKGDFIFLEGLKNTPDRTNQLIRSGRTVREWLSQHPLGGPMGQIEDPSAPLWVKTKKLACRHCGEIPRNHDDSVCTYEPDYGDRLPYDAFLRRFKDACEQADIPENKRRPYNLRHTRLTEVATFMGYEQLNKFAGWKPGSDRAKVYVHLNNDDVNQAIRDEYGLSGGEDEQQDVDCPFCGASNQASYAECRNCGRPLSLEQQVDQQTDVLERLNELEEKGVLEKLEELEPFSE